MTPLCEMARRHGTDKSGHHEYTPAYYGLFKDRIESVKRVLEIGIGYQCHHVGGSVHMWEEFFPNADVVGLDSNGEVMINEGRIRSFVADQNDPASLLAAMEKVGGKCDLIVDDGSHVTSHQIVSMLTLLPFLTDDGVYIVEDLEHDCRPEEVGASVPAGYRWWVIECPSGVGCGCGCDGPEYLLAICRE